MTMFEGNSVKVYPHLVNLMVFLKSFVMGAL